MKFTGLDLETAPCQDQPQPYALQPWRAREGTARVTSCAVAKATGQSKAVLGYYSDLKALMDSLRGQVVVTWNGVFDVSWLIASAQDVSGITWVDAMHLWKWAENSQHKEHRPAWSLVDGARHWLKDWLGLQAFLDMKAEEHAAGENDEYWEARGRLDALVTVMIAERVWAELTPQQQTSAMIEGACIVPVARSWVSGIYADSAQAAAMAEPMAQEMRQLEQKLGTEPTVLRSPKQLGALLYDEWGLPCSRFTDAGARSSDKAALTYLADIDDRMLDLLRWRELNTQYTKFIEGIRKCKEYLGTDITHPSPKLFSTYTGRFTYASRSGRKGEAYKAKIGLPIHQWPRNKQLRGLIKV